MELLIFILCKVLLYDRMRVPQKAKTFYKERTMHMKKTTTRLHLRGLALAASLLILLAALSGALTASAFWVGQNVGIGTVTATSSRALGSGLTYANTTLRDKSSNTQNLQTITFNPATSNYMPLVYSQFNGYGATTLNSAKNAESKYAYDVKGGVNASFFSMLNGSANTYGGVNISDGKIIQGCNSNGATWMLAFNSNGKSDLVYSRVIYTLSVGGTPWYGALDGINLCPNTASATNNLIYYYDTSCGTKTDSKTAGVEVVCNKLPNSELTVGGTLTGEIVSIRNVSSGGSVGQNQFVLYARDSSQYAASLRALSVGSRLSIRVEESLADAKTVMENCSSAFVTYGYNIVRGGVNVTSENGLGESFNKARAQRSGIGVKADGTIILVASPGRTSDNPGLTVYQLADYFISQGCVTAVNLDGGGSTQMCTENTSGALSYTLSSSRRVANSILVVARPTISGEVKNTLNSKLAQAKSMLNTYVLSDASVLQTAVSYAESVSGSPKSMPGDYTKAIMRLEEAMQRASVVGYQAGIYRLSASSALRASASDSGTWLDQLPAGTTLTVTQSSGNFGYTKYGSNIGWVSLSGASRVSAVTTSAAVFTCPDERQADQPYTVSWNEVLGASGYTYSIVELNGLPDPTNNNEAANGRSLYKQTSTRATSLTIPASMMTNGKYLKIAVGTEFPQGTVWSVKYVIGSELPFADVPTTAWYYPSVRHVYENGYFSGVSATVFSPDSTMTRGMMALVMYRMAGCPTVTGTLPFTDVADNAYYRDGVLWCSQNGIASGYTSDTFAPDDVITREQAAVFLYRLAGVLGCDTTVKNPDAILQFTDGAEVAPYAVTAMAWAVENGILNGNGGRLMPKSSATRAQIATLLMNLDQIR